MTKKRLKKEIKWAAKLPRPLAIQPEELEVLEPRQKMTVSEWALNRRVLSRKTTKNHGPWSHDYVPFAIRPMDMLSVKATKQVTVMACAQSGKTEISLNFLGWIIDESPRPFGIFMPREDDANRRVNTRIRPMFESTPSLRRHLPGGKLENINVGKETVLDNMILYIGWMGSAASMADNPMGGAAIDEAGKAPQKVGREAGPVQLIKQRFKTYPDAPLYVSSTPVKENDVIDIEFKDGDKEEYAFKCPYCKKYHLPDWFANVKLDHGADGHLLNPKEYESSGHARYICPHCKKSWTEKDRWQAVVEGDWVLREMLSNDGKITGYIPATTHYSFRIHDMMLYPGFMTINKMAAIWAKAIIAKKMGDIGPLQDFYNSHLALPFEEREKDTEESALISHRGTYKTGVVPAKVQLITAGFDVQLDHIWYSVDGWATGMEAFSIAEGRIETGDTSQPENYKLIEELLAKPWPLEADKDARGIIFQAAIDCNYKPDVVKLLCIKHNDVLVPTRGDATVSGKVYRATRESKVLGSKTMAIIRYDLNTNSLKDTLYHLLYETGVPGPGYMHLHADTMDETLEQLASEEQRRRKKSGGRYEIVWVQKGHKPNHLWDCKVYSLFAAILAGAMWLREPEAAKPKQTRRKDRDEGFLDNLPKIVE